MWNKVGEKTYNALHAPTFNEITDKIPDIAPGRKVHHSPFFNTLGLNQPLEDRTLYISYQPWKTAYQHMIKY
jgi:hypothetical protein